MDTLWIATAFGFGFISRLCRLPPLVGYLFAGFLLHAIGVEPTPMLDILADLGVTLLLFTIGLKLNIKSLLKPEIWASTISHMGINILIYSGFFIGLASIGFALYSELDIKSAVLFAFALSFSSTVCAIKMLEEKGEMTSRHGQLAIGILVFQDIIAVIFLSIATGKLPSIWALGLLGLPLVRPVFNFLLRHSGHGELLPLIGFFLAFAGGALFSLVGVKADLGAIVFGALLSGQPKATELAKSLLNFKELFLVGFFLSVGFKADLSLNILFTAAIILLCLLLKGGLFFIILAKLRLRVRAAALTSFALNHFSEFGLIVAALSVESGWFPPEFLVVIALAMSLSFMLSILVNGEAHNLYTRWKPTLMRFESPNRLEGDHIAHPGKVDVLVIGMGRVGRAAYDTLNNHYSQSICGIDTDPEKVQAQVANGKHVIVGDGEDPDFWNNIPEKTFNLVLLAIPSMKDMMVVMQQLKACGYKGKIAAAAKYEDEAQELSTSGADITFNYFAEAGTGFADHVISTIKKEAAA